MGISKPYRSMELIPESCLEAASFEWICNPSLPRSPEARASILSALLLRCFGSWYCLCLTIILKVAKGSSDAVNDAEAQGLAIIVHLMIGSWFVLDTIQTSTVQRPRNKQDTAAHVIRNTSFWEWRGGRAITQKPWTRERRRQQLPKWSLVACKLQERKVGSAFWMWQASWAQKRITWYFNKGRMQPLRSSCKTVRQT